MITKTNLASKLIKHSDAVIALYFNQSATLNHQISLKYKNDPIKRQLIINNIIDRHISFRDALCDPTNLKNARIIEEHQKYFWDPSVIENGQLRGPQIHLSQSMFSDFGHAMNGIHQSGLSGEYLANVVSTKKVSNVFYPSDLIKASPDSFRQGYELIAARSYSSALSYNVHYLNDDLRNVPFHKTMLNNMPAAQKVYDLAVDHDSKLGIFSKTDIKTQVLGAAADINSRNFNQPRVVFTGTVDNADEEAAFQLHINVALSNIPAIAHVNPIKNNYQDKYDALLIAKSTGFISDTRGLIGLPCIISNDHNV